MEEEKLELRTFTKFKDMMDWANSKDGTDYIISIVYQNDLWCLFFIK